MHDLQISGNWQDLGQGRLSLNTRPYDRTGLLFCVSFVVTSAGASVSTLSSLAGFEALAVADQFDQLYDRRIPEAALPCDAPGVSLRFCWHDSTRCIAEANGTMVQELFLNEQCWRVSFEIQQFRFEGFHLQRLSELVRNAIVEHGIDTAP